VLNAHSEDKTPIDLSSLGQRSRSQRSLLLKQGKHVLLIILRTVYHRGFIFHMPIGIGGNMTHFDFEFTRSKGKVIWVTFVKKT